MNIKQMKRYALLVVFGLLMLVPTVQAQEPTEDDAITELAEEGGLHMQLKQKFIDGSPLFMSMVALALVFGLAFCIERISYLTLSEINAKKLMRDIDAKALSRHPWPCGVCLLPGADAHQREYGRHRAQHLQLRVGTDGQA